MPFQFLTLKDEDRAKQTLYTCPSFRLFSHLLTLFLIPIYCTLSNPSNSLCPVFSTRYPKHATVYVPLALPLICRDSSLRNAAPSYWSSIFVSHISLFEGTGWRSWFRICCTSLKVTGSIPDGVIGIFRWHNSSVLWLGSKCGEKNKSNEYFKTTFPNNNYNRPKTTGECEMF